MLAKTPLKTTGPANKYWHTFIATFVVPLLCLSFLACLLVSPVQAQTTDCSRAGETQYADNCTKVGDCSSTSHTCVASTGYNPICAVSYTYITSGSVVCGGGKGVAVLGGVQVPRPIWAYNTQTGQGINNQGIGIIIFISRLLRVFTILCGLWFMFNILIGGYTFITSSGDSAVFGKFKESLFYSLIGLFLIAVAYLIAGLVGTILFGDAKFIINPTLTQAGTIVAP